MQIVKLNIENFRGIKKGELYLSDHTVLVGDNNTGKSSVLEAIDLVLGPDRLSRFPVIDEHDFYAGQYIDASENSIPIKIELIITNLNEEQERHFKDNLEWWSKSQKKLIDGPPPESTDKPDVISALRVGFIGKYDKDEDNFEGTTYFASPLNDNGQYEQFKTSDKRKCGFLYLRTIRTGSRALSLERGSLLDIILKLQDKKLQMWEDVLKQLQTINVAEKPEIGISEILEKVQKEIRTIVPSDWIDIPHIKVTDLTRENLRKVLTFFINTKAIKDDGSYYSAPFQHQGTGTINTLVLSLLSIIAELKQNVIFAMEEPEIAIPPHTQKRIVNKVKKLSSQSIFTSHSPYIMEEFDPDQLLVLTRENGILDGNKASLPPTVKMKKYGLEVRKRFCEALLAKRVLITEGITEQTSFIAAARKLNEIDSNIYSTLEALGIAIVDAETESQIEPLGKYFSSLGKEVFAVFDKQSPESLNLIKEVIPNSFESPEKGFENLILKGSKETALKRFALDLVKNNEWPSHLKSIEPEESSTKDRIEDALFEYFRWGKGASTAADFLYQCSEDDIPNYIINTLKQIKLIIDSPIPQEVDNEIKIDEFI